MKTIVDLHIHSKYSRACSKDLTPENLGIWAAKKGIDIMGTGDFTHPGWLSELKDKLIESDHPGLYQLRQNLTPNPSPLQERGNRSGGASLPSPEDGKVADRPDGVYFLLTAEVSSIYKQGDKVRRVHNILLAPNFEAVDKLIAALEKRGANLKADGRPIMGIPCHELVKMCKDADEQIELIPAHAWTPHFGVFGSLSGFDTLEEAFADQAQYIFAIETGLSSDPKMNWQVAALDRITFISNSDAHSLAKLGREANVLDIDPEQLSYQEIIRIIKAGNPKEFLYTIEFFPEEGKYHLDGHRECKVSMLPEESKKRGGLCPVCGRPFLLGVQHRVDDLANRSHGYVAEGKPTFKSIIPLEEIIADSLGVGPSSKKVRAIFEDITSKTSEFEFLIDTTEDELRKLAPAGVAEAVLRVRSGQVKIEPGYDGVFGKISIFDDTDRNKFNGKADQRTLF